MISVQVSPGMMVTLGTCHMALSARISAHTIRCIPSNIMGNGALVGGHSDIRIICESERW